MTGSLQCIDYNELMYSHGEDGGFYSYVVTTPGMNGLIMSKAHLNPAMTMPSNPSGQLISRR